MNLIADKRTQTMDLIRGTFLNVLWTEHNAEIGRTNSKFGSRGAARASASSLLYMPSTMRGEHTIKSAKRWKALSETQKQHSPNPIWYYSTQCQWMTVGTYNLTAEGFSKAVHSHTMVAQHYCVSSSHLRQNVAHVS